MSFTVLVGEVLLKTLDLSLSLAVALAAWTTAAYLQILHSHGKEAADLWLSCLIDLFRK